MATRKDVARRAGVSEATVSYVINDSKRVTPEVRERVREAVRALNYQPNLVARSLVTKRTRHVAMLVDNLINPHYCEMLEGAQSVATQNGYIVSVISVDYANAEGILDLASRGVDGVMLTLTSGKVPGLNDLLCGLPAANIGKYVKIEYKQGIDEMAAALKALGHERAAFLSGIPFDNPKHARYQNWMDAVRRCGLSADPALLVDGDEDRITDEAAGERAMMRLLSRKTPFTAVFAVNDLMALGAMRALQKAGLQVPGDVSVVGCDHLRILDYVHPALSTLDAHSLEIGQCLMRLLIEEIHDAPRTQTTIVAKFVPKESLARAKR